jgi:hypothetical protein
MAQRPHFYLSFERYSGMKTGKIVEIALPEAPFFLVNTSSRSLCLLLLEFIRISFFFNYWLRH